MLRIEWNNDKTSAPVRVTCEDGSVYESDYVLVTCSLGFLKENANKIFSPELPNKKRKAIDVGDSIINSVLIRI